MYGLRKIIQKVRQYRRKQELVGTKKPTTTDSQRRRELDRWRELLAHDAPSAALDVLIRSEKGDLDNFVQIVLDEYGKEFLVDVAKAGIHRFQEQYPDTKRNIEIAAMYGIVARLMVRPSDGIGKEIKRRLIKTHYLPGIESIWQDTSNNSWWFYTSHHEWMAADPLVAKVTAIEKHLRDINARSTPENFGRILKVLTGWPGLDNRKRARFVGKMISDALGMEYSFYTDLQCGDEIDEIIFSDGSKCHIYEPSEETRQQYPLAVAVIPTPGDHWILIHHPSESLNTIVDGIIFTPVFSTDADGHLAPMSYSVEVWPDTLLTLVSWMQDGDRLEWQEVDPTIHEENKAPYKLWKQDGKLYFDHGKERCQVKEVSSLIKYCRGGMLEALVNVELVGRKKLKK